MNVADSGVGVDSAATVITRIITKLVNLVGGNGKVTVKTGDGKVTITGSKGEVTLKSDSD